MNRFATLCLAAAIAAGGATATHAKDLSLAYWMGPKHPMNKGVFQPFADKLAEVSGGEMTVSMFPGGALNTVPPKQ